MRAGIQTPPHARWTKQALKIDEINPTGLPRDHATLPAKEFVMSMRPLHVVPNRTPTTRFLVSLATRL